MQITDMEKTGGESMVEVGSLLNVSRSEGQIVTIASVGKTTLAR